MGWCKRVNTSSSIMGSKKTTPKSSNSKKKKKQYEYVTYKYVGKYQKK